MAQTLFEELKHYVAFGPADEAALHALYPLASPHFAPIADVFYQRIFEHEGARRVLVGGERSVGQLKVTFIAWMERLLLGPWDEDYFELRSRIGHVHVRINLPQHYLFGAMNVVRRELEELIDRALHGDRGEAAAARAALGKMLDLELAILLHAYREDILAGKERSERLSTFGQLVGSIGHELRNPLGVMESSLFILKGRTRDDERAARHIDRIGEQLGIANTIVTDLLDMIRDRPLARETVAPAELVEAAAAQVRRPEKVSLQLEGLGALPKISGDASQLRQVFVNLLDNAVHAAGAEGEVRVEGREGPSGVSVAVEDSGPGVEAAMLPRLFEPLVTTRQKGIGLGLALAKRIVERHGGTIAYEPLGRGARFVVRLPRGE